MDLTNSMRYDILRTVETQTEQVGVINAEGPPVPIPNTEVKLCRAENTWLETVREDKYSPTSEVRVFTLTSFSFLHSSVGRAREVLSKEQREGRTNESGA